MKQTKNQATSERIYHGIEEITSLLPQDPDPSTILNGIYDLRLIVVQNYRSLPRKDVEQIDGMLNHVDKMISDYMERIRFQKFVACWLGP